MENPVRSYECFCLRCQMAFWNEIEMRIVQRSLVLALFGADFAYGKTTFDNSLYEQIIRRKDV